MGAGSVAALGASLLWAVALFVVVALSVMVGVYLERKVAGHMQARLGPMRTGPHGIAQTLADTVKLIFKEDIVPAKADRFAFVMAPLLVFAPALMSMLVIPFAKPLVPRDLSVGVLYFLAIPAIGVIGLMMAGLASHNNYSLLGGLRSAAQLISYEIPRALSVLAVVMLAGSMSTVTIVERQSHIWYALLTPIGFALYLATTTAELNRTPFDLPEAEAELVGGFHTEYSGLRWAFFMMGEYANFFVASAFGAVVFLGGGNGPLLPPIVWFIVKTYAIIFFLMWVKWTVPRFRIDQLMTLSWRVLIPIALLNLVITSVVMLYV